MGVDSFRDGGAYCRSELQLGNTTTVDAEVNGDWIGRLADKGIALSAKLIINYSAVLAADETLSVAAQFQDAVDGSGTGAADYADAAAATVVATGDSGGSTETGTAEIDIDLSGAREFVRSQITLSTSAAGTVAYSATLVLFGDHRQPSTKAIAALGGANDI